MVLSLLLQKIDREERGRFVLHLQPPTESLDKY
jgi:hypothetical protein